MADPGFTWGNINLLFGQLCPKNYTKTKEIGLKSINEPVIFTLYVVERSNLQVLYDDLLDGYSPNVRPVLHNTQFVQVHANMKMQQIISMVRNRSALPI